MRSSCTQRRRRVVYCQISLTRQISQADCGDRLKIIREQNNEKNWLTDNKLYAQFDTKRKHSVKSEQNSSKTQIAAANASKLGFGQGLPFM